MGAPTRRRHNARPAAVAVSDVAIMVIEDDVGHSLAGLLQPDSVHFHALPRNNFSG